MRVENVSALQRYAVIGSDNHYGGMANQIPDSPRGTSDSRLRRARASAAEDEINLTNINSPLVNHVSVGDVDDFVPFGPNHRYTKFHHYLGLFCKRHYVLGIDSPEFVHI